MAVTQNSRSNKIADTVVGYSYLTVDDSKIFTLADGVDDADVTSGIPKDATGAMIVVEHLTSAPEMRVSTSTSEPDITDKRGAAIYEDQTVLFLGYCAENKGSRSELDNLQFAIETSGEVKLHVTYLRFLQ